MRKLLMPLMAAVLMAAVVGGVNFITDSAMQLDFLTSCEKLSTDGSGSFLCNPDNDTDTTYSVFYPYLYLNSTTFGLNTSAVQRRVSDTCAVGSSIRVIAEDGSVTCETDSTGSDEQVLVYNTGNDTITIEGGNSIDISSVDTDTTIPDTNETPRVTAINSYRGNLSATDCGAGDYVTGIDADGDVACGTPTGSGDITGVWGLGDPYLYNGTASGSANLRFNASYLYDVIDARSTNDTDTNTNAGTICSGTQQYLDGDGNCDTGYLDADGVDSTGSDDQVLVYNTGNDTITIEGGNSIDISSVDTDTTIPDTNESTRMDVIYTYSITNRSLWDTAYSWGDHSGAGYLTSYTDTVDGNASYWCNGGTTYLDGDGNCDDLSGVYQPLEATLTDIADGTIAENLVNTANPWADNEVADTITASNYLPLVGGTMSGDINMSTQNVTTVDCIRFASGGTICGE